MFYRLLILGIVFTLPGQAQDISTIVPVKLQQVNSNSLQQKIYVHTDKSFYMAGDIIWLKAYNINGITNKPMALDGLVYAELLDRNNKPVVQAKISS